MRILIVIPEQDQASGNWVSAKRFRVGLELLQHQVLLHDTPLQAGKAFRDVLHSFSPEVVLLLHAYRSGLPWLEASKGFEIPIVTFLTGTDINRGLENPQQQRVIESVLTRSARIIAQNPLLVKQVVARLPQLATSLTLLSPGILIGTEVFQLRNQLSASPEQIICLCPAGVRPVKGVFELLLMFDSLTNETANVQLVFCGPIIDQAYGARFMQAIKTRSWATYLGTIPQEQMCAAMREADIILNNSETEGLANALLEADTIGVPILARKIAGNQLVVEHGRNGFLYENQEEFLHYASLLLNPKQRTQLACPAPGLYNPQRESAELASILESAIQRSDGQQ